MCIYTLLKQMPLTSFTVWRNVSACCVITDCHLSSKFLYIFSTYKGFIIQLFLDMFSAIMILKKYCLFSGLTFLSKLFAWLKVLKYSDADI